ncbi:hypothetical protein [Consotaella aegiceratis]|uniref:hypothetical protein n=1 Tax=Consotaella aegiceratis TaxID=3097961 RepID=UPI002F41A03F
MIYKNVIPRDFAALHRQEGVLSQVLGRYEQYVSKIEGEIRDEISEIEIDLKTVEAQALRDQSDLRKVYAMEIIARIPPEYNTIQTSNGNVNLGDLPESDTLESIIAQKSASVIGIYRGRQTIQFPDLEESLDPFQSFTQRKKTLGQKTEKFKQSSEKRIKDLKAQLASLRTRRFNEVVRENADLIDQIFAEVGESRELLKYLILEGYLDDTYYQYISLFHRGRLSPNDNNFLIQIRAYNNPGPDFPIDNTAEVIASMRDEDFARNYVLNRFIVDHLLSDTETSSQHVSNAADFMAAHFSTCGDFFRSYYAKGTQVEKLIQTLAERWPNFAAVALDGADGASHAARILAYAPEKFLRSGSNAGALKSFLSDSTRQVLAEGLDFDIGRLRSLAVEISDVESLADFPSALAFVAQEGLYRISIDNIRHILGHVVGWQNIGDLEKRHFSTLKKANDAALLKRIYADFPMYVSDVLLTLAANTDEDVSAILEILTHEDVEHDSRVEFLNRQAAIFPNFDDIPAAFHQIVLKEQRVEVTWENCLGFMTSDAYNPDLLTEFLQDSKTASTLSRQSIPGDEASFSLRQFIIGNNALDSHVYRSYVRQLPKFFNQFPEVDDSKIKVLVEERKIKFTPETFLSVQNADLQVLFVATNFPAYEAEQGQYSIDDGFRAKLLRSGITDPQKLRLISDMDEAYVAGAPSVAADIGPLLDRSPIEERGYSADFVKSVIVHSRAIKVQISLFNRLHPALSDAEVREVLRRLPGSFRDIATYGRAPKIESSDVNRKLAIWLKERKIISSFSDTLLGGGIRIHTFKKEP